MLLALALGAVLPAAAQQRPSASVKDLPLIKAAMVYNICKFVDWPQEHADDEDITLGVLGSAADDPDFDSVAGKILHDRPVRIVEIADAEDLATCHVLYVSNSAVEDWNTLRDVAVSRGILTISDIAEFAAEGGIVGLKYHDGRLRFDINKSTAQASRLGLSSQLLKIASKVY